MSSIVSYRKVSTPHTIIQMQLPDQQGGNDEVHCTELCTIDGTTYVAVPDSVALPEQPQEIAVTVTTVALTEALRDAIKNASPHYQLINVRVTEQIRERYSRDDEIKCLRLAPSPETSAWNAWVEDCRAWGRQEKAKLGLR